MDQEVKGQKAKPKMKINEILARALEQFYQRGETPGILRGDEMEDKIQLEAINISTELLIKNKKKPQRPGRMSHGPPRISPPFGSLRKRRKDEGTAQPARHRSGNRPGRRQRGTHQKDIWPQLRPIGGTPPIHQTEQRSRIDPRGKIGRALPIMFVKKKDCKLSLCANYRVLNEVTKKDRHPLPLISEALDSLGGAKYFTKLDIKDAYHNIRIREGDEWKRTFSTKLETYQYLVMPFGLCNAGAAFPRWINKGLMEHIDMCCIVYLDDVLVCSNTLQQHHKDVSNILEAIRKSGMKIKPSKCEFHQNETEYLGFIIG